MTQNTEDQPKKPKSILEAVIGQQNARTMEKTREIALRQVASQERHDRIHNIMSTLSMTVFTLAIVFGLAIGCLAMWDAVVG
jgi:hypothetical protein